MFPDFTQMNIPDSDVGNSEICSDLAVGISSRLSPTDFSDFLVGQLRSAVLFAKKPNAAPFIFSIIYIVLIRALKQMARVKTRRVVAFMKGLKSRVEIGVSQFVDESMRLMQFALIVNAPIVVGVSTERPFLAFISLDFKATKKVFDTKAGLAGSIITSRHLGSFPTHLSLASSGDTPEAFSIYHEFTSL